MSVLDTGGAWRDTRSLVDGKIVRDMESVRSLIKIRRIPGRKMGSRFHIPAEAADRLVREVRGLRERLTELHAAGLLTLRDPERVAHACLFSSDHIEAGRVYSQPAWWSDRGFEFFQLLDAQVTTEVSEVRRSGTSAWIRCEDELSTLGAVGVERRRGGVSLWRPIWHVDQDPEWLRARPADTASLVSAPALGWPEPFARPPRRQELPRGYGGPIPTMQDDLWVAD